MTRTDKIPSWLALTADGATITLSKASLFNGVTQDRLTLSSPTVSQVRRASQAGNGDDEQRELILLASLAQVSVAELEELRLKDYQRLQVAYFRLVQDDGV